MKKILLPAMLLAFSASFGQGTAAPASKTKLLEKVVKKGSELVIPYEKYQLENGLIVIIHEDHSDPVVHVDVTYHVGSAREQEGRSGFAHFFEHMMFQGSDNVADEEHIKIVSAAGGTMNGTTTADRTNYFETMPNNELETSIWLEADRMGFLLDAVTQKKFEVQRATVKNERGQNYDNRPYGLIFEKVAEAMYPKGHPYSWPTIGYLQDLDRVNVDDLKKFFLRWYGPNNAVLTVAGDAKPADVVRLAEKYFGNIPRCPEVKPQDKTPVKLDKDRYISYEDNIRFPLLQICYPTVPNRHPDEAPLDILASILGGTKSSIFYQNLQKTQQALQVSVQNPCMELAGQFQVSVIPFPGKSLAEMEALVKTTFEEFEKKGISEDDLVKFKATYESNLIRSLNSVHGKAAQLAAYQTYAGNPNYIKTELASYKKVTKEDLLRVYNQYIKGKPAVILSVVPKGQRDAAAKPDNFTAPAHTVDASEGAEYKNLAYNKAKDNFDRTKRPAKGANPVVAVPEMWKESFPNGLKVIGNRNTEIPSVTLQLSIKAGHRFEPKSKAGIAQLTADLLNESTTLHSSEQMANELEKLGSSIDISAGSEEITLTISCLSRNVDATLKLAQEMLLMPKFDEAEFKRSRDQNLAGIADQATQPTVIANNVFSKLMYGEGHIMSTPTIGTAATVASLQVDDVKDYYAANFVPSISKLVIVGDITKEQILPKLTFLKDWKDKKVERAAEPALPKIDKTKIYIVNKDKAPQSEIRIGYMALPYDATGDYYKARIMNFALGGAFNSRINLNLREEKGWTYGAGSGFRGSDFVGPFTAYAGVKGNATDSSVVEFLKELKKFADTGITPEELEFTKSSVGQSDALRYETNAQKADFLRQILNYNLDKTYVDEQNKILNAMTKEEIAALAKKYLPLDRMVITAVGDKAAIEPGLAKLGYEIVELDTDGNIVPKKEPLKLPDPELKKPIEDKAPADGKKDKKKKKK